MLNPGTLLQSRYRIAKKLGEGGMGAVYRAWDVRLDAPVALKEMMPQPGLDAQTLTGLRHQFRQEAVVLARLNHPNLVRVTDFFEEGGSVYLVMDFVQGENLADRITREGAQEERQVIAWAEQLLGALAYCHSEGILHRDLKPQNVIIRADGQAILVDFGLVKLWDPQSPQTKTVMRGMGTPEYAPPEQYDAFGHGHTGPSSDLYSLGATLYHALTGSAPPTATMRVVNPEALIPLRQIAPHLSARLEQVITQATQLRPALRYQTAAEMRAALTGQAPPPGDRQPRFEPALPHASTRVMPGAAPASPFEESYSPPPPKQRSRAWLWWAAGAGALLLLCVVIGGIGSWLVSLALATPTPLPTLRPTLTSPPATTPAVTATPRPTSTPDVKPTPLGGGEPAQWPILISDHFADNTYGWNIGESDGPLLVGSRAIEAGRYLWEGTATGGVVWSTTPNMDNFGDFYLILEGQVTEGVTNARYGVLYHRMDGDNYHMFRVSEGYYQVRLRYAGEWFTLIDWTETTLLHRDRPNQLVVIGQDTLYTLYINGTYLDAYSESRLPSGNASIAVGLDEGNFAEFAFTFFEVRAP